MALRIDAIRGIMRLASAPYDETIVDWIRTLPQRRYHPVAELERAGSSRKPAKAVRRDRRTRGTRNRYRHHRPCRRALVAAGYRARRSAPRDRRDRQPLQRAQVARATRAARAQVRRRTQDLDGSADPSGSAGDPDPRRRNGRSGPHAASSSRAATIRDRQPTDRACGASKRHIAGTNAPAIAGRALAPPHRRRHLRQPRASPHQRAGHRVVRAHPSHPTPPQRPTRTSISRVRRR